MHGTREERARFAAAIAKVALVTPKREKPDKTILKLYYEALKDFGIATIEEAADILIRVEPAMYAIPPPGRWRQICLELFELKPDSSGPKGKEDCPACEGTGFRPVHGQRAVTHCECRDGGTPPPDIHMGLLDRELYLKEPRGPFSLDDEMPPRAGENELQRRRREWGNLILHCACCGLPYRRRSGWRCCAPPAGYTFQRWSEEWHRHCDGENRHRCPIHCQHPAEIRKPVPNRPAVGLFPMPEDGEHVHDWAVRTGLRDADAPGPDDEPPPHTDEDDDLGF